MNRKEDFFHNFFMSDIKTQMFKTNLVLIIGFGGIYTSYAFYTFGWYVNYRKYNYIGVDYFDTLLITTVFLIIFFCIYAILRFKFFKKIYSSFLVFIKDNRVLLMVLLMSILTITSSLIYGICANEKREPQNILDVVNYSYVTEHDSVELTCVFHNNTPADISKLDSVTVVIKDKSNQKTVSVKTYNNVRFEDWCIKGNGESKIILQIPYSFENTSYTIELDIFEPPFAPLIMAEVEFESEDAAARSCESAVDIVDAKIPARMIPAVNAGIKPNLLKNFEMSTIIVSAAVALS